MGGLNNIRDIIFKIVENFLHFEAPCQVLIIVMGNVQEVDGNFFL